MLSSHTLSALLSLRCRAAFEITAENDFERIDNGPLYALGLQFDRALKHLNESTRCKKHSARTLCSVHSDVEFVVKFLIALDRDEQLYCIAAR